MSSSLENIRFVLLTRFMKGQAKVPQMPEAAMRIRKLLEDPRTSLPQLARVINSDPPLAAYLMQFAESPLIRGLRPCVSMSDLLARLGTRQLSSLVLGFTTRHLFAAKERALQNACQQRWRKARERAAYCAVLAQRCNQSLDEAMLAGLLQDIGSLLLLSELEQWPDFPRETQAFDELCDYLSGDVGALVLVRWQLPTAIIECARQRNRAIDAAPSDSALMDLVQISQALLEPISDLQLVLPAQLRLGLDMPLAQLREALQGEQQLWLRMLA